MHYSPLALLTLTSISLMAQGAPIPPQKGILQQNRRRAVDYPVQSLSEPRVCKYNTEFSVVQVDGGQSARHSSPNTIQAITNSGFTPTVTATVIYKSIAQRPYSEETVIVACTQELFDIFAVLGCDCHVHLRCNLIVLSAPQLSH